MKKLRYLIIFSFVAFIGLIVAFLLTSLETIPQFMNPLLMVVLPLGLGVYLAVRLNASWRVFGIGAATFIASQILHIPFNLYILNPQIEQAELWITALLLGLSAGIFEETARYIAFRKWLPETRSWAGGLMYGTGHGGIEAILLGGLAMYVFLQFIVLRGMHPETMRAMVGIDSVEATLVYMEAYWGLPWYDALLGVVERISAIIFHLAASLLVMLAVRRRNLLWFAAAVALHTLINAVAVYAVKTYSIYQTEGLIFLVALLSLGIIFALRRSFPPQEAPPEPDSGLIPPSLSRKPVTKINPTALEDSRYD